MAGSIMVRYAQKTYKQRKIDTVEKENSAVYKKLTHSVDIIPESISYMTFSTQKDAGKFAERMRDKGYHIIEITDDYRKS
jgi:hypothetical protein